MTPRQSHSDEGFGLVEVIVAIAILGLIAVAVLPMIIMGLDLSARQSSVATATQLVSETIDQARSDPSRICTEPDIDRTVEDGRGNELHVVGEVVTDAAGDCDGIAARLPTTIKYRVQVVSTASGEAKVLAEGTTRIFLPEPNPSPVGGP